MDAIQYWTYRPPKTAILVNNDKRFTDPDFFYNLWSQAWFTIKSCWKPLLLLKLSRDEPVHYFEGWPQRNKWQRKQPQARVLDLTFLQADNFLVLVEWANYFQKMCKIETMLKNVNKALTLDYDILRRNLYTILTMFLYINTELVDEKPVGKCFTLS